MDINKIIKKMLESFNKIKMVETLILIKILKNQQKGIKLKNINFIKDFDKNT